MRKSRRGKAVAAWTLSAKGEGAHCAPATVQASAHLRCIRDIIVLNLVSRVLCFSNRNCDALFCTSWL